MEILDLYEVMRKVKHPPPPSQIGLFIFVDDFLNREFELRHIPKAIVFLFIFYAALCIK